MDRMLAESRLADNRFLAGLVSQYGAEAVETASMAANGYPASLVGSNVETMAILNYLEHET